MAKRYERKFGRSRQMVDVYKGKTQGQMTSNKAHRGGRPHILQRSAQHAQLPLWAAPPHAARMSWVIEVALAFRPSKPSCRYSLIKSETN